ncbi:hypothetical protein VNO80_16529 [Phaseolus coccineus]|uniref:Transmembrane protein n=1 Tax=Phaseolus coccineus TaxID=3886 RepID=A0AAN9R086_PHACN
MMNLVPCILFLLRSNTLFKDTLTYPPPQKCLNLESKYISFLLRPHTISCVDKVRPLITPQSTPRQSVSVSIQILVWPGTYLSLPHSPEDLFQDSLVIKESTPLMDRRYLNLVLVMLMLFLVIYFVGHSYGSRYTHQVFKVQPKGEALPPNFFGFLPKAIPIPPSGPSRKHNGIGLQSSTVKP